MNPSPPSPRGAADEIDAVFARLRQEGRVGLMTHLVYGYPSVEGCREAVEAMVRGGVDMIEIQLPFSDPTADGPTITEACQRALDGGARIRDGVGFVAEMAREYDCVFLFMSYFNILFNYRDGEEEQRGVEAFARAAAAAGAAGLIVPDIPPEERQEGYPEVCRRHALHPIYVTSPNASTHRLETIARVASGFVYCTSRTGTTGRDVDIAIDPLSRFVKQARVVCDLPVAIGFSISRPQQIEALRGHAEMAVVGSHLLRVQESEGAAGIERVVRELVQAGR